MLRSKPFEFPVVPAWQAPQDQWRGGKRKMRRDTVRTGDAPAAIGPYSQAVRAGGLLFCSGQIPLDPATGKIVDGGIEAQTERVLKNLEAVLIAGGSSLRTVVKTTVFLVDMADFPAMNAIYGKFFPEDPPARATVQVVKLPAGARVEVEAVAVEAV
jgi:2-iminobutanoate/2-iminopropanoate deaminase